MYEFIWPLSAKREFFCKEEFIDFFRLLARPNVENIIQANNSELMKSIMAGQKRLQSQTLGHFDLLDHNMKVMLNKINVYKVYRLLA